jgi:formylglycine-generating enzyme required for sulfatase activity
MKSIKYLALLILIIPILFSCESTTSVNTVATPVITPESGTYTSAQSVTITCATDGATIYYTMDGTDPTSASTMYAGAIDVVANATIKAMATKVDLNDSAIATKIYAIYNNMVMLDAGSFVMGRTVGAGDADELPVHSVTLSAFYIGKYEVTQAEWFATMGNNPSNFLGDNNRPVEQVSFYQVLVYCNTRSMDEGLTPAYTLNNSTNPANWGSIPVANSAIWNTITCSLTANGYRLPTESEWEYAARGGTNTPDFLYAGSDTVANVSWYNVNAVSTTHPVGQKTANGIGAFDMSGNVQEWVWDWYGTYTSASATNPTGPASNVNDRHVIRGGSWDRTASDSRVVFRNWGTPDKGMDRVSNSGLGFRVVRAAL